MTRDLLVRGLLAGVLAGLAAFGIGRVIGEPSVDAAIAFEERSSPTSSEPAEAPLVTRTVQSTVGLLTAAIVVGVAMGGLFALAFTLLYGRTGDTDPLRTAGWLTVGAFVVMFLVPFLKYPANPPAVGDPATIQRRTALYWAFVIISLAAAAGALRLRRTLASRLSPRSASVASIASYFGVVLLAGFLLPDIQEVPANFPAVTLWSFRESSVTVQLAMWTTLGIVFGLLAQRLMRTPDAKLARATAGPTEG